MRVALFRLIGPEISGLAVIVIVLAVVEILIGAGAINGYIVPKPSSVLESFGRVLTEESLAHRFFLTSMESLVAGLAVAIVGIPLGALLSRMPLLRAATETWIAAFSAAPLILAYPLFLVIFGRNIVTISAMGFFAALAPVVLKTLEGLVSVRPALVNVGKSFNLTPAQLFWKVELPAAIPSIFVGLRLGLILALINVVGLEFLINFGGLGQLINDLAERYDLPATYAAIFFVVLVSVVFFAALERIERWLRPVS